MRLEDRVEAVEGIGPRTAATLRESLGIEMVRDLVEHYPRDYDDLGDVLPVARAQVGEPVTLVGTIVRWTTRDVRKPGRRRLEISEAELRDRAGDAFHVTFFNQRWRERQLPPGHVAAFSGDLEHRYGKLRLSAPRVLQAGEGGQQLVPIYPATEALPTWRLHRWITAALAALPPFPEHLPEAILDAEDLLGLDEAVRGIHEPEDRRHADAARRRLKFDELFTLQVGLQWRRARLEAEVAGLDNAPIAGGWAERFIAHLPFAPTGAQQRAFEALGEDLAAERPMHRLLQGDVGSGKTLVAVWTMLGALDHGRQGALMAPTEVLAEQHHRTLLDQLAPLGVNVLDGIRVELLTSSTPASARRRILGQLLSGDVHIVVGTHALLEEGVRFDDLGVVVVDEQHRFGVHQRMKLKEKGSAAAAAPDVLVMTATPIPRSLALTLFGDLDVTVLDELPPGRQPVTTQLITPREAERRGRVYGFIRDQAAAGHRTFVVCPLVEGSSSLQARAAEEEYERLRDDVFPDLRVGLVHGRMRSDEKDAAMAALRRGDLDVLVATTVIEVGVDVPDATVMVIEDAERFGISQLHQLRGRVGRGVERSFCVLFAGWSGGELTDDARARLEAVVRTTDGFELAEVDLELRGEGQFFGTRQTGVNDLRIASLPRDLPVVERARELARDLVASDPHLAAPDVAALRAEVSRRWGAGLDELEALAAG